ncbi:MAG: phosphate propanoyltransferase [Clostridiales Family XIII bacterium]|jgi:putative phosphotransacetylase|nr:phosphate propanoyltransferase [Clostridiales Family XIII bacterium]
MGYKVEVGISNKHLHLSAEHIEILFGKGHVLTPIKDLKQPGQFASEERVDIVGPKGTIKGLRVLGPARPETQVELSLTDVRGLGIKAPIRESGKLEGTPGVKIVGPEGEVEIDHGVIVALRHIHLSPSEAVEAGVKDKDVVRVKTSGSRPLLFEEVLIRSGETHLREFHVDTDEGNAAGIDNDEFVEIMEIIR